MPTRNAIKEYVADSYYHIYSRGVNKEKVFLDDADKVHFLSLLKRYLSKERVKAKNRTVYKYFGDEIEMLCYCLMNNHIHLLVYQVEDDSVARFMRSLMTSYGMYFNKRHNRVGPVFQSRYLARRIDGDTYLHHISRYIHLNPHKWRGYKFSSIGYYLDGHHAEWLHTTRIMELFNHDIKKYEQFITDYSENEEMRDELYYELADGFIENED